MCTTGQLCTAPYSLICPEDPEASELAPAACNTSTSLTILVWQGSMAGLLICNTVLLARPSARCFAAA